jgi:hypothetical protein
MEKRGCEYREWGEKSKMEVQARGDFMEQCRFDVSSWVNPEAILTPHK